MLKNYIHCLINKINIVINNNTNNNDNSAVWPVRLNSENFRIDHFLKDKIKLSYLSLIVLRVVSLSGQRKKRKEKENK